MLGAISEGITKQFDIKKSAKETWEILRKKNVGVDRVIKAKIQSLRKQFETLMISDDETVSDFAGKLSEIVTEMGSLGEFTKEKVVVAKFLRATPAKFDAITTAIKQFSDIDTMTLDEAIGSPKLHEDKIKHCRVKRDEQVLLAKAMGKIKKYNGESSRGRGQGRGRGHGRSRGRGYGGRGYDNHDEEKPHDKSKVRCYNCEKLGHFAYECRRDKEERINFVDVDEKKPSTLLMAIFEGPNDVLLQGVNEEHLEEGMWYLDTRAILMEKSEAFQAFVKFKGLAEAEKGVKIRCLRTDKGGIHFL
ncbi:uncharacterized protein LOC144706003 [Wolffia australiana]